MSRTANGNENRERHVLSCVHVTRAPSSEAGRAGVSSRRAGLGRRRRGCYPSPPPDPRERIQSATCSATSAAWDPSVVMFSPISRKIVRKRSA